MDPISLAVAAVRIASAVFTKDATEAVKTGAAKLWNFIKDQFNSADEQKVVKEVEDNPNDQKLLEKLTRLIEDRAKANKKFSGELEKEIQEAKNIPGVVQIINADKIGAAIGFNTGSFTINN